VKSIFRFIMLVLIFSGWAVAALCLHVVRTPDPQDPHQSKLVVIPKQQLGVKETYVDARNWTMADVPDHGPLILEMIKADKLNELKFLADPHNKEGIEVQLIDALTAAQRDLGSGSSTTRMYPHVR